MSKILRAGAGRPRETPPAAAETEESAIIYNLKREYGIILSFFQSINMNITTLDKNLEFLEKSKDAERSLVLALTIMLIRKFNLDRDEFTLLYNTLSDIPMSSELLAILFEDDSYEGST